MVGEATGILSSPISYLAEPFAGCEDYNADREAFMAMLQYIVKVYIVRDLVRSSASACTRCAPAGK